MLQKASGPFLCSCMAPAALLSHVQSFCPPTPATLPAHASSSRPLAHARHAPPRANRPPPCLPHPRLAHSRPRHAYSRPPGQIFTSLGRCHSDRAASWSIRKTAGHRPCIREQLMVISRSSGQMKRKRQPAESVLMHVLLRYQACSWRYCLKEPLSILSSYPGCRRLDHGAP